MKTKTMAKTKKYGLKIGISFMLIIFMLIIPFSFAKSDDSKALSWKGVGAGAATGAGLTAVGGGVASVGFWAVAAASGTGLLAGGAGGIMGYLAYTGLTNLGNTLLSEYSQWYKVEDWEVGVCSSWGGVAEENGALGSSNIPADTRLRASFTVYKTTLPPDNSGKVNYIYEFNTMLGNSEKKIDEVRIELNEAAGIKHSFEPGASSLQSKTSIDVGEYIRTYDYYDSDDSGNPLAWNATTAKLKWKIAGEQSWIDVGVASR